jgi:hypothetical protein
VYITDFNVAATRKEDSDVFRMMTKTGTLTFSAPEIFNSQVYE